MDGFRRVIEIMAELPQATSTLAENTRVLLRHRKHRVASNVTTGRGSIAPTMLQAWSDGGACWKSESEIIRVDLTSEELPNDITNDSWSGP